MTINLTSLYGPNNDSPAFFEEVKKNPYNDNPDYNILCGDFNVASNQEIDTYEYKQKNNLQARRTVYNVVDIFRTLNPKTKRYTWKRRNLVKRARLDLFLASLTILDMTKQCSIEPSYRSDHSIIEIELTTRN